MSLYRFDDTPLVTPYCGTCDLMCERLKFDRQLNPWYWSFQVQCCGRTRGARLSIEEILRLQATGEKFYALPRRGHAQTIKALPRLHAPKAKPISIWMPR